MHRLYSATTRACALPMFVQCGSRVRPGQGNKKSIFNYLKLWRLH